MKLADLFESPSRKTEIQLDPGLSRDEAMKLAPWKPKYGDCRGFSYCPKSGIACWM